MLKSMTGFGKADGFLHDKSFKVEIKSLNSKGLDLSLKLPLKLKEREIEIRKLVSDPINRGKADCLIFFDDIDFQHGYHLNPDLVKNYISEIKTISSDGTDLDRLKMAIQLPDAVSMNYQGITDEEFDIIKNSIQEAIVKFNEFRTEEGKVLADYLIGLVENIKQELSAIEPYEKERIETYKTRIEKQLQDLKVEYDEVRFHQEMVYYIEKLDVSEEKIRLKQHCDYFIQTIKKEQNSGRKLGFISQEMGREINTLGAKANHAEIQKKVVQMKDDLEKIKEQVLNVL